MSPQLMMQANGMGTPSVHKTPRVTLSPADASIAAVIAATHATLDSQMQVRRAHVCLCVLALNVPVFAGIQ
jgi:hypothetical protein